MVMSEKLFTVPTDPYGLGYRLYARKDLEIMPGLTLLVGCNGAGKTTLLKLLQSKVEKTAENNDDIICLNYNNLVDGGTSSVGHALLSNKTELAANLFIASEGEKIRMNIGHFAGKIGSRVRANTSAKELWIFMDAIGSGMSIDAIVETKDFFHFIINENKHMQVYIIVATNEYEYTDGERCLDVGKMKYVQFSNYEEYKKYILASRKRRDSQEKPK